MKIVVVGKNSLLARLYLANSKLSPIAISHEDLWRENGGKELFDADYVINFAFHPKLLDEPYKPDFDIDTAIAVGIANRKARYVMISSRKVYAEHEAMGALVSGPASGLDTYGKNKLTIEESLRLTLDEDRLTILRVPNVVGWDPLSSQTKPSCVPQMLTSLRSTGQIRLDVSPFTLRGFTTDRYLANVIDNVCRVERYGIRNVGCGPTSIGKIAEWLIQGFGSGELIATWEKRDQFWLGGTATLASPQIRAIEEAFLRDRCLEIGRLASQK